ncbi:hypothetical protein Leryth_006328, partial [Lithospermum erythrorhizon]
MALLNEAVDDQLEIDIVDFLSRCPVESVLNIVDNELVQGVENYIIR